MIGRRTLINLAVFFAVTLALAGYGYFSLIQNPLNRPTTLFSYIDDTGGVRAGFTVAMRGVPIGHVDGLSLAHVNGAPKIKLAIGIDSGVQVPSDARVQVERANPLGEQQVDLIPQAGSTAPPAKAGQVLEATSTPTPPDVGQVVEAANRIFAAVPTDDLRTVIHELATAFNGRAGDIRTLIEASAQYAQESLAYQDAFRQLLTNAPPVLNTVTAVGPQLRDALSKTTVLADLLARRAPDLVNLARSGTTLADLFTTVLTQDTPNLACVIKDFGDVGKNLAASPQFSHLDQTLVLNKYFFGPVDAITPVGPFPGLKDLSGKNLPGSPARSQTFLRVRTLLPPQMPPAVSYPAANRIPDTYPGAACVSQFGAGVPAGSQVGAAAPSEGAKVIAPATPTVPVETQTTPTPSGAGSGPGNVSPTAVKTAGAAPAAEAAAVSPLAPAPAPSTGAHPEIILFGGFLGGGLLLSVRRWRHR